MKNVMINSLKKRMPQVQDEADLAVNRNHITPIPQHYCALVNDKQDLWSVFV